MILRNPAIRRDSFFTGLYRLLLALTVVQTCHLQAQGIIGHVAESFSRQSISNATIEMYSLDSLVAKVNSDSTGRYVILSSIAGRVSVHIHHAGYEDYLEQDILLDGYSTIRLDQQLSKKSINLPEATVVAKQERNTDFVRTIKPEDMLQVAGNFEDPVRIAHSQPGIVLTNDQANHFSARGQSPVYNSWYLEGLQIVNPNHTSNAGTFSDLPTQYGGGVNIFSAQVLGSTDIYTGPAPIAYDRNSGALIDMHLHETSKPEWRAKAGLIGLELGGGTRIGNQTILDLNLRYSFTGLLTNLGADFGGEKIGFYDGVIALTNHGDKHTFKLFGWAGKSFNDFDKVEPEIDRKEYKDFFDINYDNSILGTGIRYDLNRKSGALFQFGAAYSTNDSKYKRIGEFENEETHQEQKSEFSLLNSYLRFFIHHSEKVITRLGVNMTNRFYEAGSYKNYPMEYDNYPIEIGFTYRGSADSYIQMGNRCSLDVGVELLSPFEQYEEWNGGYSGFMHYTLNAKNSFRAGYRHAPEEANFINDFISFNDRFISDNLEAGWSFQSTHHIISVQAYWQHLSEVYVANFNFQSGNYLPDIPFGFQDPLGVNHEAIAVLTGLEGTWQYTSTSGWHFEFNQSIYDTKRGDEKVGLSHGRYNGQYTTHLEIAKEVIHFKKGKNRIWNYALRGIFNGGLWEQPINTNRSDDWNTTVYQYPGIFNQRLPAFKRIDASITRTISNPGIRWRFTLDIQNLFSITNIAYHYYDPYLHQVVAQEQLGIIPVLSVQASW